MLTDKKASEYLAIWALLILPWAGTQFGLWGLLWDFLLLAGVLWVGLQKRSLAFASLFVGYAIVGLYFGMDGMEQVHFVSWAGIFVVYGWQQGWPSNLIHFWGGVLAALLGSLPALRLVDQGLNQKFVQDFIDAAIVQYDKVGILATLQQEGITELELRKLLEEALHIYHMLGPGFAALAALLIFGLAMRFLPPVFRPDRTKKVAFSHWRLPWYAIWGVIIALICYLAGDQFAMPGLQEIGYNLMLVYAVVTLILGLSLYVFFLSSPRIPRMIKWMIVMFTIFSLAFSIVAVLTFGLFDIVFNFRRLPDQA